jgi:hypothetical protein
MAPRTTTTTPPPTHTRTRTRRDEELRILRGELEVDEANITGGGAAGYDSSGDGSEEGSEEGSYHGVGGRGGGRGGGDLIIGRDAPGKALQQQLGGKGRSGSGAGRGAQVRTSSSLYTQCRKKACPTCGATCRGRRRLARSLACCLGWCARLAIATSPPGHALLGVG